jgi:protein-disulfide isomerase
VSRDRSQPVLTRADRRRLDRVERGRARPRHRAPSRTPAWRSPIALLSAAIVVGAVALIVVLNQKSPGTASGSGLITPTTSYPAGLENGEVLGKANAPVTLEIYGDFQCPVCGVLARSYLPQLVAEFVTTGKVKIAPRDLNFRGGTGGQDESTNSAIAASCAADQGKYWEFHDMLFWNQAGENQGAFSNDKLQAMANEIGLNRSTWDACRDQASRATTVAATTSQALAAGINSTPTLLLNGKVASVGLPRTYADLANLIRTALGASPASNAPSPS